MTSICNGLSLVEGTTFTKMHIKQLVSTRSRWAPLVSLQIILKFRKYLCVKVGRDKNKTRSDLAIWQNWNALWNCTRNSIITSEIENNIKNTRLPLPNPEAVLVLSFPFLHFVLSSMAPAETNKYNGNVRYVWLLMKSSKLSVTSLCSYMF